MGTIRTQIRQTRCTPGSLSVWQFFVATYAVSWLVWVPAIILRGTGPSLLLLVLGAFVPSTGGVIFTYLTQDRDGRRDFWTRVTDVRRIGWRWMVVIVLFYPLVNALAALLAVPLGQAAPSLANVNKTLADPGIMAQIVVANLIVSGFSEELGWRGYALDRLQARRNPLAASLIVGLLHGLWHLPLFLIPGITQGQMGLLSWGAVAFLVGATAGSVAMAWVYSNTRRSILSAILMHFMANLCMDVLVGLQGAFPPGYFGLYAGALVLVDSVIIAIWRPWQITAASAAGTTREPALRRLGPQPGRPRRSGA